MNGINMETVLSDVEVWKKVMQNSFDSDEPVIIKAECFEFDLNSNQILEEIMNFTAVTYSGNNYALFGDCQPARNLTNNHLISSTTRVMLLVLKGNGYVLNEDSERSLCEQGDLIVIPHMTLYRLIENLDNPMQFARVTID